MLPMPPRPRSPLSGRSWAAAVAAASAAVRARAIPSPMAVPATAAASAAATAKPHAVSAEESEDAAADGRVARACSTAAAVAIRTAPRANRAVDGGAAQMSPRLTIIHKRWPRPPPPPPPPPRFRLPLHATPAETAPLPSRSRCSSTAIVEGLDARAHLARWAAVAAARRAGYCVCIMSTSEASASNSEQLLRTPPRSAGGAAMGACGPLEGKLSIDVEQATASLADQLAAVCCSPPRHQLGAET